MRDPVLNEAIRRLAAEAATRFSSLVATGEEIPFDVAEDSGENALFYRYVPLTSRFVAERHDELRSLPGFEPACAAALAADVAAPYLEARGETVPADPDERATKMLFAFLAGLWDGCTEFSLDRGRLDKALHVLDAEARDVHEADVLIAPIIGLQMPLARLQLPSGVRVVRADTVDAPTEAMRSEGMNRKPWEPQFLALAEKGEGPGATNAAMHQLRDLVSVMRLFKEGGIGIGPYVFAPTGEDRWQRIATGAPGTRPGGYNLTEAEAAELAEFAGRLEARPDPEGALAWAVARFEMGCERSTALEGLSDHLLALRALLAGDGSVGAALPRRAAALIAEPADRDDARARIDRAFALEVSLMGTSAPLDAGEDTGTALGLATWVEEALRAMLRDGALGELGDDVSAAADESLITSGLVAGEVSEDLIGAGAEWDAIEIDDDSGATDLEFEVTATRGPGNPSEPDAKRRSQTEPDADSTDVTRLLEPVPTWEEDIRVTAWTSIDPVDGPPEPEEEIEITPLEEKTFSNETFVEEAVDESETAAAEPDRSGWVHDTDEENEMVNRDWLSEVEREERATLEWPATRGERPPRERIDTPRVRHLFPVPEDAEWEVRELEYDRRATGVR